MQTALEFNATSSRKPVSFADLEIGYAMANAANVTSGGPMSPALSFHNCTIHNSGPNAVMLNGSDLHLENCTVKNAGCSGVVISECDRLTLVRSENVGPTPAFHFSRRKRTYTPGLAWDGCGHTLRASTICDAPHSGVLGEEG
eukprot:SAG11_NODE_6390_length_1323_cov_1.258987_1_plen_142_part_01